MTGEFTTTGNYGGQFVVIRDPLTGKDFSAWSGKRMYLYSESGKLSFTFELAPREIEYGGWNQNWTQVDRSGREPLLLRKGDNLDTLKFSFMMTRIYAMNARQTEAMNALKAMAKTNERILVRYGPSEAGLWRVTEASVSSMLRNPDDNEVTRAMASVTLTRASDPAVAVGPVTGGSATAGGSGGGAARSYTVVKGDCLWNIAKRYYGNGALYPRIFDANRSKIKDPHWIYPGQVFVIP